MTYQINEKFRRSSMPARFFVSVVKGAVLSLNSLPLDMQCSFGHCLLQAKPFKMQLGTAMSNVKFDSTTCRYDVDSR